MQEDIQRFLDILGALHSIDGEFPLHYALCLAHISQDEGMSLTQLAEKTGLALPTVSRIVGALSKHRQVGKAYELIDVKTSKTERRKKELFMTAKGQAVIQEITKILG